jgi:F-type H+-transporting ATPase subunit b
MRAIKSLAPALAAAALLAVGEARAETMPQLDFGNRLLIAQVVWGAVIFALFYVLVSRWGLPKVGAVLEMRAGRIAEDLHTAHQSKLEADRAVAELTAARKKAYAQSQAEIAEAARAAKAQAAQRAVEQDARLDAQLAASEAQIGQARAAAMGALREVATDTATALVSRLTNSQADQDRVRHAVEGLLAERGLAA